MKKEKKKNYYSLLFLLFLIVATVFLIKDYSIPFHLQKTINFSQYCMALLSYIGGGYALLKMGNWI